MPITRRRFLGLGAAALTSAWSGLGWATQPEEQPILQKGRHAAGMQTTRIDAPEFLGLEGPETRITFERQTGALLSLFNKLAEDEYLKDRRSMANPFRVYTEFIRPFELEDDPADLARTALDPFSCRLVSSALSDDPQGTALSLVYRDHAERWQMRLRVMLSDGGTSEWTLDVTNVGPDAGEIIVDFPFFERICLGQNRRKNLATILNQAGHIAPATDHPGGVYGNSHQWSMQWHCCYDPASSSALGLVVKDPDIRNKRLGDDSPSIRVSTFPEQRLEPGETFSLPPVEILIYRGDWRRTAQHYRIWFSRAFQPLDPPEWFRRSDGWTGGWFGKRGGASMPGATQMDTFRDLPEVYRAYPVDNYEFAFHDRGCQFPVSPPGVHPPLYVHTTGDNILREDLGGAEALREGVAAVHALGFHFTLYVEGYIVHQTSELAKDRRAERWSIMHKNGTITGNYTSQGFYHMCPACEEWQEHLASACGRLIRETGADGVRLDSLGFYYLPCYNPAHKHPHPFVYNDGLRQLVEKVSRAMREANPNAVVTTEAPVDFLARDSQGALLSMCAREIPPMRLAVPDYHLFLYGPLGPVWGSLSGYIGGTGDQEMNWRCARFPVEETILWGEVEPDPSTSQPRIVCRLFRAEDHWALTGAWVDSDEPWLFPRGLDGQATLGLGPAARSPFEVRLPGLAPQVESAVGFDVETLQVQPVTMARRADDLVLSLDWRWFLVILRRTGCRPLVSLGDLAAVSSGQSLPLDLRVVGRQKGADHMTALLSAPGLRLLTEVPIPGSFTLQVPEDTPPGRYLVTLAGPGVLGYKRFLQVKAP